MNIFDEISAADLRKLVALDLFELRRHSSEQKRALLNSWTAHLLELNLSMPEPRAASALYFRSLSRPDYKVLFHSVIDAAALPDSIVIEDYIADHGGYNFEAAKALAHAGALIRKLGLDDPVEASACAVRLIRYGIIVEALSAYSFETLITFADMQPVEHLAVLFFKARGKTTVTLQHGLYVDYGESETINVINYKHQPSDHFLAWGQHTADLIKAHNPKTRVTICGKPNLEPLPTDAANGEGLLVVLDQEVFRRENAAMLRLVREHAASTGQQVRVRFHPNSDKSFYNAEFPGLEEGYTLQDAAVVVGHTSSLLYEAAAIGVRVVQFATEAPGIPIAEEQRFNDGRSLSRALRQAAALVDDTLIACIGVNAREKYRDTLRNLATEANAKSVKPEPAYPATAYREEQIAIMRSHLGMLQRSYTSLEREVGHIAPLQHKLENARQIIRKRDSELAEIRRNLNLSSSTER